MQCVMREVGSRDVPDFLVGSQVCSRDGGSVVVVSLPLGGAVAYTWR